MAKNPGRSIGAIFAVTILALFAVFTIPVLQAVQEERQDERFIQEVGETLEPAGDGRYEATLDSVDGITGDATINVTDISTSETQSATISENDSHTFDVAGNEVTATYNEQVDGNEINVTYSHFVTYGFGDENQAVFSVLDILILAFLFAVSILLIIGGGGI